VSEDAPTPTPPSEAMERLWRLHGEMEACSCDVCHDQFKEIGAALTAISDALAEGRKDRERLQSIREMHTIKTVTDEDGDPVELCRYCCVKWPCQTMINADAARAETGEAGR